MDKKKIPVILRVSFFLYQTEWNSCPCWVILAAGRQGRIADGVITEPKYASAHGSFSSISSSFLWSGDKEKKRLFQQFFPSFGKSLDWTLCTAPA